MNVQVRFTELERAELLRRLSDDAVEELAGLLSIEAEVLARLATRPTDGQFQKAFHDVAHAAGLLQRRLAVLAAMDEWLEPHLIIASRRVYGHSEAAAGLLEGLASMLKSIEIISDERERALAGRRKHATVPRGWLTPVAAVCRARGIRPAKSASSKFFAIAAICASALTRASSVGMNVEWAVRTFEAIEG